MPTTPESSETINKQARIKESVPPKLKTALNWLSYLLIPLIVYFGNIEVQTYLGKKALESTGLPYVNFSEAKANSSTLDKPILADVSAIWCPSCRKLDQKVFGNKEVQDVINANYVFTRLEYESDEGRAFVEKYNISGFPTLLVLDSSGKVIKQLGLTFDPKQFIAQVKK